MLLNRFKTKDYGLKSFDFTAEHRYEIPPTQKFFKDYRNLILFISVQLLHKLSIHAADGPQKLLKVRLIQYYMYITIYINDECTCVVFCKN